MSEWVSRRAFVGLSGLSVAGGFSTNVAAENDDRVRWLDSEIYASVSSATVVDDTVYIGTWESGLCAFEKSGQKRWTFDKTGDFYYVTPNVVDGVCYGKNTAGSLFALEADSGELLWSIKEEYPGPSSPTVYEDRCYISGDERLAAIDTFTGEIDWTSDEILGPVGTGLTINNEQCFVSGEGGVTAHDINSGKKHWDFDEAGYAESGTRPDPSGLVVNRNTVYVGSDHGSIYAIGARTGEKRWVWSAKEATALTSPTVSDGVLSVVGYVPRSRLRGGPYGSGTELIILELSKDQPEIITSQIFMGAPKMAAPTIVKKSIVWPSTGQNLMVYSMEDGAKRMVSLGDTTRSDPIVVDGESYIGGTEGVMAVDIDVDGASSGLRVGQGSTGHHDTWAEEASLEIDSLDVVLEETTLEVGDETNTAVTATFANGREEPVLERSTLESANLGVATVDDGGTIQAISAGETDISITYRNETEHVRLVVEGDDSMPASGIVGTAIGVGSGSYILKRSRE